MTFTFAITTTIACVTSHLMVVFVPLRGVEQRRLWAMVTLGGLMMATYEKRHALEVLQALPTMSVPKLFTFSTPIIRV